ncbi:MAG: protein kinase [Kofleriaceae bacterium]|nr:protein kinase [Kofleriaceae bacterium]
MTRYELLDRIGVGGMAEIFRGKAVAAGGFEKPVAIKRILPHLSADQRFVELLIAEAKVLSQLRHRNIVQIFDVGLGDDGKYFLVMEFVDGKDLLAIKTAMQSRRQRLPLDIVLHIGAELCDALGHAHAAKGADGSPMKLVHRDISPSNILISRAGEVKLTDFGIAKRAEEHTGIGGVRGKFAYISPEQARNEHLDARSDVFSAAILLWELLTGRPLFSALTDLDALRGVRDSEIPLPSSVDPSLPAEVDAIIMTALAKDPARRYTGALQFGAKLRTLRYSLNEASGDPAAELARAVELAALVPAAPTVRKAPPRDEFDVGEATVIRIRTADAFATGGNDIAALSRARQVIERFEEEETRMSQLGPDGKLHAASLGAGKPDANRTALIAAARGFAAPDEETRMSAPAKLERGTSAGLPPRNTFFGDERTALAPADVVEELRVASEADELDESDLINEASTSGAPKYQDVVSEAASRRAALPLPKIANPAALGPVPTSPAPTSPAPMSPAPVWAPPHAVMAYRSAPHEFNPPAMRPRAASPTLRDAHAPHYRPGNLPTVAGFDDRRKRNSTIVFALVATAIIATLAFAITRALMHHRPTTPAVNPVPK